MLGWAGWRLLRGTHCIVYEFHKQQMGFAGARGQDKPAGARGAGMAERVSSWAAHSRVVHGQGGRLAADMRVRVRVRSKRAAGGGRRPGVCIGGLGV